MATTTTVYPGVGVTVADTSPVSFIHGSGQVASDVVVEWDFDNDGDFDGTLEDITARVMAAETRTGRDWASQLTGKATAGELRLSLDGTDDAFNYFNTSSPLNTAPNSLKVGRKIRVRTTESTPADPVLLARDRFGRADGSLSVAETGQSWTAQTGFGLAVVDEAVSPVEPDGTETIATVEVGDTDHYAQVTVGPFYSSNIAGVVVRWTDSSNYSYAFLDFNGLDVWDINGGVATQIGSTYSFAPYDGVTVGLGVSGTTITGYVDGVPVVEGTLTGPINGTEAGLVGRWSQFSAPTIYDFHVWSGVDGPVDGILWTGEVAEINPSVTVGPVKVVDVVAYGRLARLAGVDVDPPRTVDGAPTGHLVGNVLARASLLHPPAPLDTGAVTTGPVGLDAGNALTAARAFEETELGFLYETPEGPIGFQDSAARATATSVAHFSDVPGAQFGYSTAAPFDHSREVVNRVTAGVAPQAPSDPTETTRTANTAIGVANHVDVVLPTTAAGDFLVVIIASTVANASVKWTQPYWWAVHRGLESDINLKVFSHFCDGTESGDTVRFYTDSTAAGGAWTAHIYRFTDWYESYNNGVVMNDPVNGATPVPLEHGWGRYPTTFIVAYAGLTSVSGGTVEVDAAGPVGYESTMVANSLNGSVNGADVALMSAWKTDIVDAEAPTAMSGLTGYAISESLVFAVRGYNGPHTVATLKNPRTTGGAGLLVTVDDTASQDDHNAVRTHANPSNLFASEADATTYADGVLATYADDRPILAISFYATASVHYRNQAIARRVGDKITVVADNDTGLGINREFFIESIGHRWSNAGKLWEVTWELSPA